MTLSSKAEAVSDERLERLVATHDARPSAYPSNISCREVTSMARELLSRRAANSTGARVEVKALEWEPRLGGFISRMNDPLEYTIEKGAKHWRLYVSRGYVSLGAFDSADEAKAAAQADFNARILSSISLSGEDEPVAWLHKLTGIIRTDKPAVGMGLHEDYSPLYTHPSPAVTAEVTEAARDVLAERRRQVEAEGWTPEHDDAHDKGELSAAAGVYALAAASHDYRWVLRGSPVNDYLAAVFKLWPFEWSWFKPKSRRQDKVRAAALLLADIEREDRAALSALKGKE